MERLETLQSINKPKKDVKEASSKPKDAGKNKKVTTYHLKRFCKAYKDAGKPHRVYSSHDTNKCRGQGKWLFNGNPNLNGEFKKQMQKMMAATVRKELKGKRENDSESE